MINMKGLQDLYLGEYFGSKGVCKTDLTSKGSSEVIAAASKSDFCEIRALIS